ncbi:MAG: hypothetical protein HY808_06825 [Nitrospirae bacterium]|nr:hypothetical protein [Nitrospirota bacterium]
MKYYIVVSLLILNIITISGTSVAGVLFDASARITYEDNIFGSPADIDKQDDVYLTLSAALGGYTKVAEENTYLFLKGGADSYFYDKNTQLNEITGFLNLGVYRQFGDILFAQAIVRGKLRDYREQERSGSALGGAIELWQQVTGHFSIHEGYEYERNDAKSDSFTYDGHWLGVWVKFMAGEKTFPGIGYSYLVRKYDDPTHFESRQHTFSATVSREIWHHAYINFEYDFQINTSNSIETNNNNIFSAGLTYSY